MNKIQIIDCTLRDGGYCNDCHFEYNNIKRIVAGLMEANIDIVECGFLTNQYEFNTDVTRFTKMEQFSAVIPKNRKGKLFVALMDYGKYDVDTLPDCDGTALDGIRIAFHKKDRMNAIETCRKVKNKGYKVFIQGMVSLRYTDEEYIDLIHKINELEPYAFYIVDSFGQMKKKDLIRLLYIVDHNLKDTIKIGFHSHNNMQLAYSNAQSLVDFHTKRDLIIDSSIYGMGRGAGNLNTELLVEYLNDNAHGEYELKPLLTIIDEILNGFYQRNYWGYSLPNYLSAAHGAHPNYAVYLDDKKTLTVEDMNEIFDMMDSVKKVSYDKNYAEELYSSYMSMGKVQEEHLAKLEQKLYGKTVLLIAPGKSSIEEVEKITEAMEDDSIITIGVNSEYSIADTDFIFLSNLRRYKELSDDKKSKCIVTSNIPSSDTYLQVKYSDLVNGVNAVKDNAGLMAINLLMQHGVKKVFLAGFDGYSHDSKENYADSQLAFITRNAVLDAMNIGMTEVLEQYSKKIEIEFLTSPKHISL